MPHRQPSRPKLHGIWDENTRTQGTDAAGHTTCAGSSGGGAEEEGDGRAAPVLPLVASISVSPGFSVPSFSASDIMLSAGLYQLHAQHVDGPHVCTSVSAKPSN